MRVYINQSCKENYVDVVASSRDDAILAAGRTIERNPDVWDIPRDKFHTVTQVWEINPGQEKKLLEGSPAESAEVR